MKKNKPKIVTLNGKDELNLVECPFCLLSDRVEGEQKTLEFIDKQNEITRVWVINGSNIYGLPHAVDEEVYIGMLALSKMAGFKDRKVYFNQYELLKLMKWPTSGREYKRLELAMTRLGCVTVLTDYLWNQGKFVKGVFLFHIIEEAFLDRGKRNSKNSYFVWSSVVFNSLVNGNIKNLDLGIYFNLKTSLSKRFFRIWDKRLYKNDQISFDLKELAHEKLGISRSVVYPSSLKQKLEPALKEYKAKKLLSSATYFKKKDGNWILNIKRYKEDPEPLPLPEPSPTSGSAEDQAPPKEDPLLTKLTSLGIPNKKALAILKEHSAEKVEAWVESLPKIKPENPAGYLLTALSEDWPLHPEAQKYLDGKIFEKEKQLREEYSQYLLTQVTAYLEAMDPAQLKEEIEAFRKLFILEWDVDEDTMKRPHWVSKFENDFKWQKAQKLHLPTFEQWKSE